MYLVIYGHVNNSPFEKTFVWKASKEEAEAFQPSRSDYMVYQIIYVPEGKQY